MATHLRLFKSLCLLATVSFAAHGQDDVGTWQRWEHTLVSDHAYASPCTEAEVRVRFDGPDGQTREGMGFWDGEERFLIRCVFPTAGEWRWETTCSDASNQGLHGQSGKVRVTPSRGEAPLTRHGYLRVSDDHRLLVYADGTPFLWIGDTCWAAPVHATEQEWQQYVADRAAKGYSVLQVSIASDWALEQRAPSAPPFLSALPDISKPNPVYFQRIDHMLAEANDQGLAVLVVGLMETTYRYPPPEQIALLSRYIAARYSSYAVIFSPSFDSHIHEAETLAAAMAVREAAPANLITMHMGTAVGPFFHGADWLSFDMYQSGHNNGDRARQSALAITMPAELLILTPRKPLVNGEAIYEGDLGGPKDVRRTAWLTFLSGAVGYTAGINEVYEWSEDVLTKMNATSSDDIARLARILRAIPWWDLEPVPQRILNQPEDRSRLMAMALTKDRMFAMAYLPDNEEIQLDLRNCGETHETLWIDPATGEARTGEDVKSMEKTVLSPPDTRDWLLVLTQPESSMLRKLKTALDSSPVREK